MRPINYQIMMQYELDQRRGDGAELYADYCTLREPDSYFPRYLAMVGVGKKEYVDGRIAAVEDAGLDVRDAVPNSFALFAAYLSSSPGESGTCMILDIGAENIDMAIVRGGRVLFARNVSTGSQIFDQNIEGVARVPVAEAEYLKVKYGTIAGAFSEEQTKEEEVRPALRAAAGQFTGIIQSSLNYAKMQLQEPDLKVDRVYLSGGGSRLRGLPEYLQGALKTDVQVLDPFRNVDTSAIEAAGGDEVRRLPSDLTVAIGLAQLASGGRELTSVSIVPAAKRVRRDFFRKTVFLAGAGVVLAASLIVLTVLGYMRKGVEQGALDDFVRKNQDITTRIRDLDQAEDTLRLHTAKTEMLLRYSMAGRGALDAVSKLRKILPDGVLISKVGYLKADREEVYSADEGLAAWALYDHPELGIIVGEVVEEEDGAVRLAGRKDKFPEDPRRLLRWQAPNLRVLVAGDINASIKGGPDVTLRMIETRLTDPSRGVRATL
ncbi:MAG: pilus assembly protein PilM, partial [Planctomycetota bacterium]